MSQQDLLRVLAEFFLDSLREDASDVDNWCSQGDSSPDEIVALIENYLDMRI